jgi:hypothetical protein
MAESDGGFMRARRRGSRRPRDAQVSRGASGASLPRWIDPLLIAVTFAALARWSWRKWPDVVIDFGAQLYIPWQLSMGKVLYADIAYKEGPLSQYVNALLFGLFGASLTTLIFANLAILAALCWLIYAIFRRACDRLAATLACVVHLGVLSFSQYTGAGNYNYVCPYTHEQTHGVTLAAAMVFALAKYAERRTLRWCGLAGGCLGLIFLTKAELLIPAAATAALALFLLHASRAAGTRAIVGAILSMAAAALVPVASFLVLLLAQMPPRAAVKGLLGNWSYLGPAILEEQFYSAGMGIEDPIGNLTMMLRVFGATVVLTLFAAGAEWLFRSVRRGRDAWCWAGGVAAFALLLSASHLAPWRNIGRMLPLTSLIAWLALTGACLRQRGDPQALATLAPLALWATYALVLLGKVALNVRLSHYGFVLAMPSTLLLVVCLTGLLPALLRDRLGTGAPSGRHGSLFRALMIAVVLAGMAFHLQWSNQIYTSKQLAVGRDGDLILAWNPEADPRPYAIAMAEQKLRSLMAPGSTLVVLPEGTLLNYWLRRTNPTRYTFFTPQIFAAFGGESAVLEDLKANAPDFVVLAPRDTEEFGLGKFGVDPRYGRTIMDWVWRHYELIDRVRAPFRDDRYDVILLRRGVRLPG